MAGTSYRLPPMYIPGAQAVPLGQIGQIYLFAEKTRQRKDTGFYKIGKTRDWQERLRDLRVILAKLNMFIMQQ